MHTVRSIKIMLKIFSGWREGLDEMMQISIHIELNYSCA